MFSKNILLTNSLCTRISVIVLVACLSACGGGGENYYLGCELGKLVVTDNDNAIPFKLVNTGENETYVRANFILGSTDECIITTSALDGHNYALVNNKDDYVVGLYDKNLNKTICEEGVEEFKVVEGKQTCYGGLNIGFALKSGVVPDNCSEACKGLTPRQCRIDYPVCSNWVPGLCHKTDPECTGL